MNRPYEIRHADTGEVLLKQSTAAAVRRFWKERNPVESSTRTIDGVIVIYVRFEEAACATS